MIRRLTLLTSLAMTLLASSALGSGAARTPDVTELFTQAVATVRAQPDFRRAVVLEVDGSPAHAGTVSSAGKIVHWDFVLNNQSTPGSAFASATINYRHGEFGRVVGHKSPFLEDVEIDRAPTMTLKDAVGLLKDAGYDHGFSTVTLRSPLGPKTVPPLYIFDTADGFVGVNTKNGKVRVLK